MSERPAKGLGMGLEALLGEPRPDAPGKSGPARTSVAVCVRLRSAESGPIPNSRAVQFDEEALDELAQSIAERGVLQPILLRPAWR